VLLSSGDSFPHLIQKPRSQLGFVTYLLNYLRIRTTVVNVHSKSPFTDIQVFNAKPNLNPFHDNQEDPNIQISHRNVLVC
jgi:hypothetical protein